MKMNDVNFQRFLVWRAFLLVVLGMLILNFAVVFHKIKMFIIGVVYFLLCNDKSWKKPSDAQLVFKTLMQTEEGQRKIKRKTIVFVRHGESTWNDTFNKGAHRSALTFAVGFLPSLVNAFLYELLLAGKMDSWFYDSPLSHLGLNQVKQLGHFLQTNNSITANTKNESSIIRIMRGDKDAPASKLVSSNLRRAISTMAAAFHDRLQKNSSDSILVLPSLQEISRNPDTLSLSIPFSPVNASWIEKQRHDVCDFDTILAKRVDVRRNSGNKPVSTNGLKRMLEFCDTVFTSIDEDYVIVGGHSIWFRSFFKTFLPNTSMHVSKRKKIVNAGCVSFTLMTAEVDKKRHYMIDEESIQVIYGGF